MYLITGMDGDIYQSEVITQDILDNLCLIPICVYRYGSDHGFQELMRVEDDGQFTWATMAKEK